MNTFAQYMSFQFMSLAEFPSSPIVIGALALITRKILDSRRINRRSELRLDGRSVLGGLRLHRPRRREPLRIAHERKNVRSTVDRARSEARISEHHGIEGVGIF